MAFYYRVASCVIKITYPSQESPQTLAVKNTLRPFSCKNSSFFIHLIDIQNKSKQSEKKAIKIDINNMSEMQFLYILRVILNKFLLLNNGFFFHCSVVIINNKAHVFTGDSGAGKSTVSEFLKEKAMKIIDERAIIVKKGSKIQIFQTPFPEKNEVPKSNKGYDIDSFYLLHKSKKNNISPIFSFTTKFKKFTRQIWFEEYISPWQAVQTLNMIRTYHKSVGVSTKKIVSFDLSEFETEKKIDVHKKLFREILPLLNKIPFFEVRFIKDRNLFIKMVTSKIVLLD